MDYDDNDSFDSILTEIETSLRSSYPYTGETENQVYSAYHDDLRTVGYGRKDAESFIAYNNPFDPRLTFDGLGEHIYHPDIKDERHKAEMTQNVFLALDHPSQLMDKYLNGYRAYVRGLSEAPGSGDWLDSTAECRRLYDRISSDTIKSIWKTDTDDIKPPKDVKNKESNINSKHQLRAPKIRPGLRQKPQEDGNQHGARMAEKPGKIEGYSKSEDKEHKTKEQNNPHSNKSSTVEGTLSTRDQKELTESWAGLFKKKSNQQTSNPSSDTNSEDEEIIKSERIVTNLENETTNCNTETREVTVAQERLNKQCVTNYTNPIYTKVTNPVLPLSSRNTHPVQGGDHHKKDWIQPSYRADIYNYQTCQLWNEQCHNQPTTHNQPWSEYTNYQQSINYQSQQAYIPPPPGFNQTTSQKHTTNNQGPNFQSDLQQTGMYHNTQQGYCDQQTIPYNVQRYIQPPTEQMQSTANRYQYYGQQKPQYMYQGNWNVNSNTDTNDEDVYSHEGSNPVLYSTQPFDVASEQTKVNNHREKPRFKTRQIRANLIRIYPSKDKKLII